jgi:hypothetical protein
LQRLTAEAGTTDPHPEQGPEGEAMGRGAGGQPSAASHRQRREGSGHRRGDRAGCGEQTPGGRTLDVAVGRNKPTRPVAEQTVGGVRNAEDGRCEAREASRKTLPADAAMRERNPKGGASKRPQGLDGAGAGEQYSGEERSSERMKPPAKVGGGRQPVGTAVPVRNDEGEAGVGNPMRPRAGCLQHSEEQPTS